jgi:predicted metal-dependent enzyme (double-stranded beta helix superfamily)
MQLPALLAPPPPLARLCDQLRECADAVAAAAPGAAAELARRTQLCAALNAFAAAMPLGELRTLLPAPSPSGYRREVLAADAQDRYCAVAIVWGPGQYSPVHAHHTWCGYTVLDGVLDETQYGWCDAAGAARALTRRARKRGDTAYTEAGYQGIHCLGNGGAAGAISLHVYGVGAPRICTDVNHLLPALAAHAS